MGGQSITKFFGGRPQGSWLQLQVTRDLNHSDVRQQTDSNGTPQAFKSTGKPKLVLILPTTVLQSSDGSHPGIFTDGLAAVWIKGVTSDALKTAMSAAGIPSPEKAIAYGKLGGAVITMISAGEKPATRAGFSATKLYNFQYQPGGRELEYLQEEAQAGQPQLPPTPPAQVTGGAPAPAAVTPPQPSAPAAPAAPPPPPGAYTPEQYAAAGYQQAPAPSAPAAPPTTVPVSQTAPQAPLPPQSPAVGYTAPPVPPAPGQPIAPPSGGTLPPAQPSSSPPPPGYAAPGAPQGAPPPAPGQPVYIGPNGHPIDAEKVALLQRLQGQGG